MLFTDLFKSHQDICHVCGQTPCNCTSISESENPKDVVAMDVPFLIRALEYAREDAKGDLDLHNAVERMLAAVKGGEPLDMDDYNQVFGAGKEINEGAGLDGILARYPEEVENFKQGGDLDYDLESALWDYYFNRGDIRNYNADAGEWIAQQLASELGLNEQGVAEGFLGDREYNRVMPFVKRIASEVSDYDRDEFGEELWSLLDQKYGSKFAQLVLDDLDFYWDTYTELTGQQGVAEGFADEFAKFAQEHGGKLRTGPQPTKPATVPAAHPAEPIDRAALEQELKQLSAQLDPNYEYSDDYSFWSKQKAISDRIAGIKKKLGVTEGDISQLEKDIAAAPVEPIANMEADEKIAGRHDADDFDSMVNRLKKLAGAGPLKTVYDPQTRRYKNVPVAQQPNKK